MKTTTWMKAALMMALLASGGAVTLAAKGQPAFSEPKTEVVPKIEKSIEESADKQFYRWVKQHIGMPEFIQDNDERNRLVLNLNVEPDGKIIVDQIIGSNERLNEYVRHKLENLSCPAEIPVKPYHFAMRFYRITA